MYRAERRRRGRSAAVRPCVLGAAAILFFWLSSITLAQAHAYIVSTDPPANGSYESSSGTVAISFDEPVDILDANAIELTDPRGSRIDEHDASIDPNDATRVVVHVPRNLSPGVYTVHWRVVSADTHVVHGVYQIGVGTAVTSSATADQGSPFDPEAPVTSILRGLSLLGALMIGGSAFMRRLFLERLEPEYPRILQASRMVTIAGAALLLLAAIPSLLVQAAAGSGHFGGGIAATLMRTPWGWALLVRVAVAVAFFAGALRSTKVPGALSIAGVIALLVTFSATGHALSQPSVLQRTIAGVADLMHFVAAATWIGGILTLAAILYAFHRAKDERLGQLARSLFARFTPAAIVAVAVLVLTGFYASVIHLSTVTNLVATTYGRFLLAKVALVVIVLGLGYVHLRAGLRNENIRGLRSFAVEVILGILVIVVTAFLIGQMPAMKMAASIVVLTEMGFQ